MKKAYLWAILLVSIVTIAICAFWPSGSAKGVTTPPSYGMGWPQPQIINQTQKPGYVYLIAVDRLTLQDLADNQDLFGPLTQQAALGLMSVGTFGGLTPDNSYASIGAGAPISAANTALDGLDAKDTLQDMPAGEIYRQRTGLNASDSAVLQLDIARIKTLNTDNTYSVTPGLLGTVLQDNGIPVSVMGNADTKEKYARPAVALAMNEEGAVPIGSVSDKLLAHDAYFPGGLRSNYNALLSLAINSKTGSGLVVVELGDLERLETYGSYLDPQVLQTQRQETLSREAYFITRLLGAMNKEQDMLLVVSPTPRGNYVPSANYLPPVLVVHNGVQPGFLTSPTTRRPGIIKNTDLASTILNFYHLTTPDTMYGRPLYTIPANQNVASLADSYKKIEQTYQLRNPILHYYILALIILVLLSLIAIFWPQTNNILARLLKPLLLAAMTVPVTLLLVTLLPRETPTLLLLELAALVIGITTAVYLWLNITKHSHELDPFIIISLITSLCIIIDLFLGAPLQKSSLLGYDPIGGARFYGIGNEYVGVLLGATIIGTMALIDRLVNCPRKLIIVLTGLYYLITLYVIAAPGKGSEVGGSIAGAFAFPIIILLLAGVKFNIRTIVTAIVAVGVFLLGLTIYDLYRPIQNQSHIGRAATMILQNGPATAINIIYRKLSMNIQLTKYSIWSRVSLVSLASLIILFYRPIGLMQQIRTRYPKIYIGLIGVILAGIIGCIFNDSGIVTAATAMIFAAPPLLYLVLCMTRPI